MMHAQHADAMTKKNKKRQAFVRGISQVLLIHQEIFQMPR